MVGSHCWFTQCIFQQCHVPLSPHLKGIQVYMRAYIVCVCMCVRLHVCRRVSMYVTACVSAYMCMSVYACLLGVCLIPVLVCMCGQVCAFVSPCVAICLTAKLTMRTGHLLLQPHKLILGTCCSCRRPRNPSTPFGIPQRTSPLCSQLPLEASVTRSPACLWAHHQLVVCFLALCILGQPAHTRCFGLAVCLCHLGQELPSDAGCLINNKFITILETGRSEIKTRADSVFGEVPTLGS